MKSQPIADIGDRLPICHPATIVSVMDLDLYDLAFVAVSVVALLFVFHRVRRMYESKRSEALRSVAVSLGMSFEDGLDIDATKQFGPFQLFSIGDGKKVRNCLSGTLDGVDVTTFGYEYTVAGYQDSTTYRQTVVLFRSNELSLPEFQLRPRISVPNSPVLKATRRIVRTITASIGRDEEIDFDTHPDFSESYVLKGNQKSAIHQVFSTRVLEYFERHKGLSVEGRDDLLLCYFSARRLRPHELQHFVKWVRPGLDLFRREDPPPHIKREPELDQAGTTTGSRIGNALTWVFAAIFSLLLLLIVTLALKNSGLWPY